MNEIDDYIMQYPVEIQEKLHEIRGIIKNNSPNATEKLSWKMPTFFLNGNLVHFALHRLHIGFYPGESGVENFKEQLTSYKYSKGAIQFPLDKPLPKKLIEDIVKFRVEENTK